ncbi:MAG: Flp pilus assembly complex ATPase component TadA [Candidatus Omnitrophica bacterium]|nr:Flp pilus assembly complex ATPase component TadA [Candidatus Omnitrophota bacterium]
MAEIRDQQKLGKILVNHGIVSQHELDAALKEQRTTGYFIGEILVSRGAAREEDVIRTLSQQLGFAYVNLEDINIEQKAIELVSEEVCLKHRAIPLFIVNDNLTIAMIDPLDVNAIDQMQTISGLRCKPVFACLSQILDQIKKYYHSSQQSVSDKDILFLSRESGVSDLTVVTGEEVSSLKEAASLAPVVEKVNSIVTKAVVTGVSDIHIEPQRSNLNCRYRIDGVLYPAPAIPFEYRDAIISRIKIMANMDIAEKRLPQDGKMRMFISNRDVDLRVSTFPTIHGENVVIRILDRSAGIMHLKQLGFSKDGLKLFADLIHRPYGIILVTGPTGSGKTTTLYAALSEVNAEAKNIITLEDPVEYEIPNVRQSQVNVKAGLTFARGLRSIVRQDPDIIMIGEIRDKETADIAIHAALTGHLVLSTLHTNDAPSAASRLVDMGVEPFLVSTSVIGILAQRLVRTLCDNCKVAYDPAPAVLEELGVNDKLIKKLKFYKEAGCRSCKDRGYAGRAGIYELMIPTDKIKELITQKTSATVIREEAIKNGMKTLRDAGIKKIIEGTTSVAEILRVTGD